MKHLPEHSTTPPEGFNKGTCKDDLKKIKKELYALQNKFHADGRYGLLVILQGVDTAGKDGTIRHTFSSMNPMGVQVTSFKKPVGDELSHDFLWRIYPHFPAKGMIAVFNRSYYEDILVPTVSKTISDEAVQQRSLFINELEGHLQRSNIHILKFFLHISAEEQQTRIDERKTNPHKRWKYDIADDQAPTEWESYMEAYETVLKECNTPPWHIIPADKRWYRNYKAAELLLEELRKMDLRYP